MKKQTFCRLTKVEALSDRPSTYEVGYWVEGTLLETVEVGYKIVIWRYRRAGRAEGEPHIVELDGLFTSSLVTKIEGNRITTGNSVWEFEPLSTK